MKELFYQDAYMREFDATVVSCTPYKKQYQVVLDKTAFYPEGGGQPSDIGYLNDVKVLSVHRKDEIVHYTDKPLAEGEKVHGVIDWDFRFQNMQEHSGEHLFSGLVHRQFGYDNVGFHMSNVITIDFNGPLTWEDIHQLEQKANEIVYENRPVQIYYPDDKELETLDYRSKKELTGDIRIVEIEDVDICACCGTHVKTTGEIGIIKIISLMNYKQGVRLELLCGKKAYLDYVSKHDQNRSISQTLKAKPNKTAAAVTQLFEKGLEKDKELSKIYHQYYELKTETLHDEPLVIFEQKEWSNFHIKQFCDYMVDHHKAKICCVYSDSFYMIESKEVDLKPYQNQIREALQSKGGGNSVIQQGQYTVDIDKVPSLLKEIF
jgi:alanyl-tRNA synthetase